MTISNIVKFELNMTKTLPKENGDTLAVKTRLKSRSGFYEVVQLHKTY